MCSYIYLLFIYLNFIILEKEKQVTYYIFNNNTQPIHYLSLIDRKDKSEGDNIFNIHSYYLTGAVLKELKLKLIVRALS